MTNLILNGLINYWPFWNSTYDFIGNAHATSQLSYGLNKFNINNSAIKIDSGKYLQVPEGVYFSGDFSVSCFFKYTRYYTNARIFDFGVERAKDVVDFTLSSSSKLCIEMFESSSADVRCTNTNIQMNRWYFVVFTLSNKNYTFYLDGTSDMSVTDNRIPMNVTRKLNYFGKSFVPTEPTGNVDISDFKIYNRTLTSTEIKNEYNNYANNWKII